MRPIKLKISADHFIQFVDFWMATILDMLSVGEMFNNSTKLQKFKIVKNVENSFRKDL